jgi:hypothetical protein
VLVGGPDLDRRAGVAFHLLGEGVGEFFFEGVRLLGGTRINR